MVSRVLLTHLVESRKTGYKLADFTANGLTMPYSGLIDEELEWREPGTCRGFAEDTEPQSVDWNFLITLPRICGAVLKEVTLQVPGLCRHL